MPCQFTIFSLTISKQNTMYVPFSKRGKGTNVLEVYNVKTLEVYHVKTLELYTVTTLEVYTVTTLEVYNVTTLEVYTIKTLEVFCYQIFTGGDMLIIPNIELM